VCFFCMRLPRHWLVQTRARTVLAWTNYAIPAETGPHHVQGDDNHELGVELIVSGSACAACGGCQRPVIGLRMYHLVMFDDPGVRPHGTVGTFVLLFAHPLIK